MSTSRPFRFGVQISRAESGQQWRDKAKRAESLGFDILQIPDHLGEQLAIGPALAVAAEATTTLRIGTLVWQNDLRHPALLAKEAATLDLLSGGRLELGIGAGWLRNEYQQAGLPFDANGVRVSRLSESLEILAGLFGGAPYSFAGEHYRITDHQLFPPPTQRPRPPILVGAGHPRMLRLAGRHADIVGFLTTSVASGVVEDEPLLRRDDHVARQIGWVREGAGERFGGIELSSVLSVEVTDDRARAIERMIAERGWHGVTAADVVRMPAIAVGSTEEIAEGLVRWRSTLGLSYAVVSSDDLEAFAPVVARLGAGGDGSGSR